MNISTLSGTHIEAKNDEKNTMTAYRVIGSGISLLGYW